MVSLKKMHNILQPKSSILITIIIIIITYYKKEKQQITIETVTIILTTIKLQ